MNSSPDGNNHNPNDDGRNRPISYNESLDRKISALSESIDVRPSDVLCGRSKASFNHVGNRRFRSIVTASLDEYNEASSKWAKSMVAAKLVGVISSEGGRFLKQKKGDEDNWYELSAQEAKAKVSHAIRDAIAAKDKTKANRAGTSSSSSLFPPATKKRDPPSLLDGAGKPGIDRLGQSLGDSTKDVAQIMGGAGQQMSSQNISLTSMATPMFNMDGPQRRHSNVLMSGTSSVQDQIQHLQSQNLVPSEINTSSPFAGGNLGLGLLGGAGAGLSLSQQHFTQQQQRRLSQPQVSGLSGMAMNMNANMNMPPLHMNMLNEQQRRFSHPPVPMLSDMNMPPLNMANEQQRRLSQPLNMSNERQGMLSQPTPPELNMLPHGIPDVAQSALSHRQLDGLPSPPHNKSLKGALQHNRIGVAKTQPKESKAGGANGSGNETEDGDNDFLDLIDTVLGPLSSPKVSRGTRREKGE